MCDESKRAEKPEVQAAVTVAAKAAPQVKPQGAATATPQVAVRKDADSKKTQAVDPEFARAENEDDDGYDPYSDRRPVSEPLFERDPWS